MKSLEELIIEKNNCKNNKMKEIDKLILEREKLEKRIAEIKDIEVRSHFSNKIFFDTHHKNEILKILKINDTYSDNCDMLINADVLAVYLNKNEIIIHIEKHITFGTGQAYKSWKEISKEEADELIEAKKKEIIKSWSIWQ